MQEEGLVQGSEGRGPETIPLLRGSSATSRHRGGTSPEPMQVTLSQTVRGRSGETGWGLGPPSGPALHSSRPKGSRC